MSLQVDAFTGAFEREKTSIQAMRSGTTGGNDWQYSLHGEQAGDEAEESCGWMDGGKNQLVPLSSAIPFLGSCERGE